MNTLLEFQEFCEKKSLKTTEDKLFHLITQKDYNLLEQYVNTLDHSLCRYWCDNPEKHPLIFANRQKDVRVCEILLKSPSLRMHCWLNGQECSTPEIEELFKSLGGIQKLFFSYEVFGPPVIYTQQDMKEKIDLCELKIARSTTDPFPSVEEQSKMTKEQKHSCPFYYTIGGCGKKQFYPDPNMARQHWEFECDRLKSLKSK